MDSITNALSDVDWVGIVGMIVQALIILVITWIIAKAVKWAFTKLGGKIPGLQKVGADGQSIGQSLGTIGSLIVWLFGLMAILQLFGLLAVLQPIQELLGGIFGFLPNLIGAGIIFFVGFMIAKIVRQIIQTALGAVPWDRMMNRGGDASPAEGEEGESSSLAQTLPKTLATVVFALIMLVVAVAALQALSLPVIAEPAKSMLTAIFNAIPNIVAALIVLGIGVLIARFIGDILQQLLEGIGTDRLLRENQVLQEGQSASPTLAKVAQVGIVLFFAVAAAKMLGWPQINAILNQVLHLGGKIAFGAAIIAAGFFIANLVSRFASGTASTVIRYGTLVLFVAIGLKYMGIANSVINLAFGALVIGGALAAALAFGLGGRDAAARQLERLQQDQDSGPGPGGNHSSGI